MKKQGNLERTTLKNRFVSGLLAAAIGFYSIFPATATAGGGWFNKNYGKTEITESASDNFNKYRNFEGKDIYFAGNDKKCPPAILVLDKGIEINDSWHKVQDNERGQLVEIIQNMNEAGISNMNLTPYGCDIFNKDGKDIGDWYSPQTNPTIWQTDSNTFDIEAPDREKLEGGAGNGDGGGGGCFLGGTKILMADGSLKNIRDIQKGDKVMSYSFKDKVAVVDEVAEKYSVERKGGLYQLNGSVCVTKEHPFFEEPDNNRTKTVIGLRQNQEVVGDSNSNPNTLEKLTLKSIRELDMEGKFKVFNMTIEKEQNYFVYDNKGKFFLVHNKSGSD